MGIVDEGILDVVEDFGKERKPVMGFSSSTGIVGLDRALGGKLPSGAIEIYGDASTGKTTLVNTIMAQAQANDFSVALCPSEYIDFPYMRKMGVDLNSLVLLTGNGGEAVLAGANSFLHAEKEFPCLLVIDSATGLRPEDDSPGNWKAMFYSFLNSATPKLGPRSCIVVTNQVRVRRSIDPRKMFVGAELDSTAKAIVDLFSARMMLERMDVMEDRYLMVVKIVASIFSVPSTAIYLPVIKGSGVNVPLDLLNVAIELGIIKKQGPWYEWRDHLLGPGTMAATTTLVAQPGLTDGILDDLEGGA